VHKRVKRPRSPQGSTDEGRFQPSIDDRQIRELRTLRFVHHASNVIFLGPPGVGKTHLSVGLAVEAIHAGFGAYFITAPDLVADLGGAYREGGWTGASASTWRPKCW